MAKRKYSNRKRPTAYFSKVSGIRVKRHKKKGYSSKVAFKEGVGIVGI